MQTQEHAVATVRNLAASSPDQRGEGAEESLVGQESRIEGKIVAAGAVSALVAVLRSEDRKVQEQAAGAIANLAVASHANKLRLVREQ